MTPPRTSGASTDQQRGDFVNGQLKVAAEMFINGLSVAMETQADFEALNAKKRAGTLRDEKEIGRLVLYQGLLITQQLLCRAFDDFFTRTSGKPNDVFAVQVVPDAARWTATVSGIPHPQRVHRDLANWDLFHFTSSSRLGQQERADFTADYPLFVLRTLEKFLIQMQGGLLEEEVRAVLLAHAGEALPTFESYVAQNTREYLKTHGQWKP